jgi:hypothetical protein
VSELTKEQHDGEAKHTPGPWRVDVTNCLGAYGVWTDYPTHSGHDGAGYSTQVCSVITGSFKLEDSTTRAERNGNARLIAAAPAYAKAWSLVPDDIKQRIYDVLHQPAWEWVADSIAKAEVGAA